MRLTPHLAVIGVMAALLLPLRAPAHEAHDADHDRPAATGAAPARFAAVSPTLELVGVLDGRQLTLYLDRAADNAPVTDARIELSIAGTRLLPQPHDDVYEATLAAALRPGPLPVTATVTIDGAAQQLHGELDLHAAAPADETAHAHGLPATAGAAVLAAALALGWLARRIAAARRRRAGGAA